MFRTAHSRRHIQGGTCRGDTCRELSGERTFGERNFRSHFSYRTFTESHSSYRTFMGSHTPLTAHSRMHLSLRTCRYRTFLSRHLSPFLGLGFGLGFGLGLGCCMRFPRSHACHLSIKVGRPNRKSLFPYALGAPPPFWACSKRAPMTGQACAWPVN